jgi:RNA polymerase sigma-70 factor (ECF subfamily)
MARRALWRSGAAKDAVPRIAHLDQDRPLVQAAKADPARFDALYRRYLARVYSYAYYELGDHHAAEDATEATFVAALTNLDRFEERARPADGEGASTFRVWLFQIARNEVAGERRRARRRPTEPIGEMVISDPLNVEEEAVRRDQARQAWRAVGRLPGERRQAVVLRFVDELSTAEIAGVLGKSEGSVRVLIHRALRSVARELGVADRASDASRPSGSRGLDA